MGTGTAAQTLTITNTTVSDYNKDAMHANGMIMNVSGSTIDPPAPLMGITGQNGLVYQAGASGTTSNTTIFGSGYGNANNANTAVLLFGATNVTLSGDTITGSRNRHRRGRGCQQHRRCHRRKSDRTDRPRRGRQFRLRSGGGFPQLDRDVELQHL